MTTAACLRRLSRLQPVSRNATCGVCEKAWPAAVPRFGMVDDQVAYTREHIRVVTIERFRQRGAGQSTVDKGRERERQRGAERSTVDRSERSARASARRKAVHGGQSQGLGDQRQRSKARHGGTVRRRKRDRHEAEAFHGGTVGGEGGASVGEARGIPRWNAVKSEIERLPGI